MKSRKSLKESMKKSIRKNQERASETQSFILILVGEEIDLPILKAGDIR
jgi:hypothetical protein